ncbi:SDR family oxidoreductase [Flammeovirga pacifica]|uniref:dTDP-4-dehydrorhamnose reductase n=1 Tax=Flammeovirga pacifica TaxID=915059 RepID=A0A1S1Z4H9_FLAPC|nr:SDR family oxidoreductase [Flammeovirga pacifica]OHX68132.1 hypothetical protein NH26_18170 [Flammeovirga pacifica]
MKNKVLITGSNGLLGQSMLKLLKKQANVNIYATGRGKDRFCENGYDYHSLDLTNEQEIDALIKKIQPNCIIHCAAMSKVEDCEDHQELAVKVNTRATEILADVAIKYGVDHFIFISTDFVFDGEKGIYKEDDERNPPNFYGHTKLQAENYLLKISDQLPISIIRTCLVYGQVKDMSRSNIMLWAKNQLTNHMPIKVVDDQMRTPTFVDDLAMGILFCMDKKAVGVYHISGKEVFTPYQIVMTLVKEYNLNSDLVEAVNASTFKEYGRRPLKTGFDISKAQQNLGYSPISFLEGMKQVIK